MSVIVCDAETGEVVGLASLSDARAASRGRQAKVIRAFALEVARERGCGKLGFWTFGSPEVCSVHGVDQFSEWAQKLGARLPGRWCLVIEAGSEGHRLHAHVLLEEYVPQHELRAVWAGITGIDGPHVWVQATRGADAREASSYLTKRLAGYLRKPQVYEEAWLGRRLFRSSRGLVRSLASTIAELKAAEEPLRLWVERRQR